jgi:hypothetical protein
LQLSDEEEDKELDETVMQTVASAVEMQQPLDQRHCCHRAIYRQTYGVGEGEHVRIAPQMRFSPTSILVSNLLKFGKK